MVVVLLQVIKVALKVTSVTASGGDIFAAGRYARIPTAPKSSEATATASALLRLNRTCARREVTATLVNAQARPLSRIRALEHKLVHKTGCIATTTRTLAIGLVTHAPVNRVTGLTRMGALKRAMTAATVQLDKSATASGIIATNRRPEVGATLIMAFVRRRE